MPKITFIKPDNSRVTLDVKENISIMQAAKIGKIEDIAGTCGGTMACATCHIYIHPDWKARVEAEDNEQSEEERDTLDTALNLKPSSRLGCQIKLTRALDGLLVALPGSR